MSERIGVNMESGDVVTSQPPISTHLMEEQSGRGEDDELVYEVHQLDTVLEERSKEGDSSFGSKSSIDKNVGE